MWRLSRENEHEELRARGGNSPPFRAMKWFSRSAPGFNETRRVAHESPIGEISRRCLKCRSPDPSSR